MSKFSEKLAAFCERHPTLYKCAVAGENVGKKVLFKCQDCGQCVLSYNAFTCCMRCPKQLRNGPCGGTRPDGHCEVYPERHCIWWLINKRAKRAGPLEQAAEVPQGLRPPARAHQRVAEYVRGPHPAAGYGQEIRRGQGSRQGRDRGGEESGSEAPAEGVARAKHSAIADNAAAWIASWITLITRRGGRIWSPDRPADVATARSYR